MNPGTRVLVSLCALVGIAMPTTALSTGSRLAAVTPLPSTSCAPVVYEGAGEPDYIIASDLPMQGASRVDTLQMTQAVTYVLRQRGFVAGAYKIGYQSCDDSSAAAGSWDSAVCLQNAKDYAVNPSVIGIVGTYNSGCARIVLPTINAAAVGPIPMISPANTYDGLTRGVLGTEAGEPNRYYPTGVRNYVRVTAPDVYQGAANARWTQRRGKKRAFVLSDGTRYGDGQAASYRFAAGKLRLKVVGFARWDYRAANYEALAQRIRQSRAGAVYLGGIVDSNGGQLIRDLRKTLGPKVVLMASDGFTPIEDVVRRTGAAANGLYVSVAGPVDPLPAAGERFASAFGAQIGASARIYPIYTAQATEILLDAIAASDGTRRSVIEKLFATRVTDGIMGTFSFDRFGDPTPGAVTIYQVARGRERIAGLVRPSATLVRPA